MKPAHFEPLSPNEVQQIDAASMEVLETVGLRVDLKKARDAFGEADAHVNEALRSVRIPESLLRWAVEQAPSRFTVYGADPDYRLEAGAGRTYSPDWAPSSTSSTSKPASCARRRWTTSATTSAWWTACRTSPPRPSASGRATSP
jgi:trimethylamine:corrinoid methyltransferase-like protein